VTQVYMKWAGLLGLSPFTKQEMMGAEGRHCISLLVLSEPPYQGEAVTSQL